MTQFTLTSFSVRNLTRKPLRTGILIIAIALLVSTLVFAMSFVRRVNSSIKITSERLGADLLIVPADSRTAAEDILLESKIKTFYMDRGLIEKIKNFKGIDSVTHQTYLLTLTGKCCDVPDAMVVAFNQESDFIVTPWLKDKIKRSLKKGEAIVGQESAYNIDIGLMDVDSVLFGTVFKIVDVLDKTGTGLDTAIFIGDENMQDIIKAGQASIKPDQISVIFAKVKSGYDPYKVSRDIEDAFLEVDTMARKDIGKSLITALKDINGIFYITALLASVLSAFLAWAVFSAIANERAREVGIMRAVGARESHIVKLYLTEVLIIGALGSLAGIAGGIALSLSLAKSFTVLKNLPSDLNALERTVIAALGFIMGTSTCVIGALSPLQRLKKMEPLVVIKGD